LDEEKWTTKNGFWGWDTHGVPVFFFELIASARLGWLFCFLFLISDLLFDHFDVISFLLGYDLFLLPSPLRFLVISRLPSLFASFDDDEIIDEREMENQCLSPKEPGDTEGREFLFNGIPVGVTYKTSIGIISIQE
jgi:hypothetical protein